MGISCRKPQHTSSDAVRDRVYYERVSMVLATTPLAVLAIVVAVVCLTLFLRPHVKGPLLLSWGTAMFCLAAVRQCVHIYFLRHGKQGECYKWGRLCVLFSMLTGLGWGSCTLLFVPFLPLQEHLILTLVNVAYLAGALTSLFPLPAAFAWLFYPIIIPLCGMLFNIPGKTGLLLGIMLIVFTLFVASAARRLYRQLALTLSLRFSNEDLVLQLQKEKETTLELNRSLEAENRERALQSQKLEVALAEADTANRAKTVFLANMSHDIRTPMTSITGIIQLVLNSKIDKQQRRLLTDVKVAADGLLGLLNDILDFSKIEAGQLLIEKQLFNLPTVLDNIFTMMNHIAMEKGLLLQLDTGPPGALPVTLIGDELRLRQILTNLVGNGIKFTKEGRVGLEVKVISTAGNMVTLRFIVKDTGVGIPTDQQEKIFEGFAQVDSSISRRFGGSGLGLTISRQLVEMMQGKMWCESKEGCGSVFCVELEFERASQEPEPFADKAQPRLSSGLKVLLVEDNSANRNLCRMLLEQDKHVVVEAENGQYALESLAEQRFDLVLMDVQMPEMDGLTATRIIRAIQSGTDLREFKLSPQLEEPLLEKLGGTSHLPIIAMTANAMTGDREKCIAAGMDNYLTKPFDPEQIRKVIRGVSKRTD